MSPVLSFPGGVNWISFNQSSQRRVPLLYCSRNICKLRIVQVSEVSHSDTMCIVWEAAARSTVVEMQARVS